ncbi:hypothetical protein ACFQ48_14190 [Hymenobacter caeli]|uniref:Uncharacterized protein n=1 Tax=Hymenobacter caeli TaxID=2735894 RepID=A0ABX2FTK2_9BACT|nr:hypothetical protein [Hymenobacter caeli]NRT20520.1 hypothetical protein [Hymenobacter caeli]
MKLKNLKSVGHNTAHSYLSTLGHIGGMYASTYLHRIALKSSLSAIEIDVLNATISELAPNDEVTDSLQGLRVQFLELLQKEGIPTKVAKTYKLFIKIIGNRIDVINIQCKPLLIDLNDKVYDCALITEKYPEPV